MTAHDCIRAGDAWQYPLLTEMPVILAQIWSHVPVPFPDPMTMLGKRESPTPAHTNGKSSQSAAPLKQRKRSKKAAGRGGTGAATVPPAQAQQPHAASQVPGTVCNTSTTRVGPVQLGSSGPGPQSAAAPAVAVAGQGGHTQGNMMNVLQHTAHAQAEPAAPQGQPSTIKTAVYSQQQQAVSSETGTTACLSWLCLDNLSDVCVAYVVSKLTSF